MRRGHQMERFWDARAREDAWFFVDNRLEYRRPDEQRFWQGGDEVLDVILGKLDETIGPDDVVLDIGCGLGRLTRALAARARHAIGLDVSREMLERARALNAELANVTWVHGDGTSLAGVEDESVDAVISHVVFQHIPDPEVTLGYVREMGRVLRPSGFAAFHVSTDPSVHARRPPLRERLAALAGRSPRGQEHPAWRGSSVPVEALRAAAADGGLVVERLTDPGSQFSYVLARR